MTDLSSYSDEELLTIATQAQQPRGTQPEKYLGRDPMGFVDSIGLGFKKAGLGTIQAGLDVADYFGADVDKWRQASFDVEEDYRKKGEGSGASGFIGEMIGQAVSPVGIATLATAPASGTLGLAAQGAKLGLTTGLTSPLEEGQSRIASGAIGAATGAVAAPIASKVTSATANTVAKTFNRIVRGKPIAKTTEQLMAASDDLYKIMEAGKKTAIKPSGYAEGALKIEKIAAGSVDTAKQQARERGEDVVYNFYEQKLAPLKKNPLSLDDFDQIDAWFQEAINDVKPNKVLGRSGNKQAESKLIKMRKTFLDTVKGAPESAYTNGKIGVLAWKEADRIRAAAAASKDLDTVISNTINKDQPAKAIQTGLGQILNNPRYASVFNDKEKKLMREAIRTGVGGEALRILGSRLAPFGGMAAGGVEAAAGVLALGGFSREAAEKMRIKGVDKVREAITSRALGTPMPTMPTTGQAIGSVAGRIAAPVAARSISEERGTVDVEEAIDVTGQPSPFDKYSDQELMQITGEELPKEENQPAVVPEVIPDTVAPSSDTSFTKENEGLRLSTYQDTKGNPTVGYGFNFNSGIAPKVWKQSGVGRAKRLADVKNGLVPLTPQEADALFRTSYDIAKADAQQFYPEFNKLTPGQQQGLVDLSYHMGLPTLKRRMPLLRKALRSQDKNAIVKAFRKDSYAKEFPARAKEIANLLISE